MPRYYLRVDDGPIELGNEGIELADLAAAREEAIAGLRGIISQEVLDGRLPLYRHIVIVEEYGGHVHTVFLEDAMTIFNEPPAAPQN